MQRSRTVRNPQDKRDQRRKRMLEQPTGQEMVIQRKLVRMFPQANMNFLVDFVSVLNVLHQYHLQEVMKNIPISINELARFIKQNKVRETPRFVWDLVREYADYFARQASTVSPHKMEELLRAIPVPTSGCNGSESNMYVYGQGIGRMLKCLSPGDLSCKRTQRNLLASLPSSSFSAYVIVRYYILLYTLDSMAAADYASYELLALATQLRRRYRSGQIDRMAYAFKLVTVVQQFVTTYRFQLTCLCLLRLMQMVPYASRSILYLSVYPYLNDIDLSTNQYRLIHFMYTIPGINLDTDPAIVHTKHLMQQQHQMQQLSFLKLSKTI